MTDRPTTTDDSTTAADAGFRDAEEFLAALGVERRPIVVRLDEPAATDGASTGDQSRSLADAAAPLVGGESATPPGDGDGDGPAATAAPDGSTADDPAPVSVAEATRIATEAAPPDEVATALGYVRRATAAQPASEGRLRGRLRARGHDDDVVEATIARARAERLVDDDAMSAALVAEWRAKGHAPRRIRDDLRRREFDEAVIQRALGDLEGRDDAAMAFQLARRRAESLGDLPPETAYRRVAGYVARRGYGEGLARKAARDAVYDQRHDDRVAGH